MPVELGRRPNRGPKPFRRTVSDIMSPRTEGHAAVGCSVLVPSGDKGPQPLPRGSVDKRWREGGDSAERRGPGMDERSQEACSRASAFSGRGRIVRHLLWSVSSPQSLRQRRIAGSSQVLREAAISRSNVSRACRASRIDFLDIRRFSQKRLSSGRGRGNTERSYAPPDWRNLVKARTLGDWACRFQTA